MHRIKRCSRSALCNIVLGLALGDLLAAGVAHAQEPPPIPPARGPAGAEVVPAPRFEGPAMRGNMLIVPIGASRRLQMSTRQPIETVVNERENVASVAPVPNDPTSVTVTGREAGLTHLTLTGADKSVERYEVLVQFDVEYLRSVLMRVAPTANIELIPAATGSIVVSGTVTRSEDVDVIMRTAAGIVGSPDRVVNGMRVEGVMQVQLDVKIATVSRSELRQLSFNFIDQGQHHVLTGTITPPLFASLTAASATGVAAPVGPPANVILGLFNDTQQFFGFLEALRTEDVSKILAEPKLVTLSGKSAVFVSGGEQAVPEISGGGLGGSVGGISFEPFGVTISFLPIVLGNGKIYLEIQPEISTVSNNPLFASPVPQSNSNTPVFGRLTNKIRTTVTMEDGQTFVLGGMVQHTIQGETVKLPVLGDLPFVGTFFSSKNFNESENEVLIVVTPHLVDPMACTQLPTLLPGEETRSPDDFELFLEGILEAPRGQREVCPNKHYVPAWKNGPSATQYPCGGGACGTGCGGPAVHAAPGLTTGAPVPPVPVDAVQQAKAVQPSVAGGKKPATVIQAGGATGFDHN